MPNFIAKEFDFVTHEYTGAIEVYQANDLDDAQAKILYNRRLTNGNAQPGKNTYPRFRFVYVGKRSWSITEDRKR